MTGACWGGSRVTGGLSSVAGRRNCDVKENVSSVQTNPPILKLPGGDAHDFHSEESFSSQPL